MHTTRKHCLLELARAEELEAVALMPGPNLFYLTGQAFHLSERPILGLFPVDAEPIFIVPALEAGKLKTDRIFSYTDEAGYEGAFRDACAALDLSDARMGVEALRMRVLESRFLAQYAPGVALVPADRLLARLRMLKEAEEVTAMRRAVDVAQRAFLTWLTELRVGMTEKEAAARLVAALLTRGAEDLAFSPIVAAGPNGALPHATPGERPFERGDWVVVDWGATVGGYRSDITRMVVFGTPTEELRAVHTVVQEANAAARSVVAPGVTVGAVDRAARAHIEAAGYGPAFIHRTGHGLGLEAHEPPYITPGGERELEVGMTFTVEPGVYLEGRAGFRVEDDVLVTEGGVETLTTLMRDPFVLAG
ncbi:MAG: M24 family metallopeptidase [Anaerolineae bacterium]